MSEDNKTLAIILCTFFIVCGSIWCFQCYKEIVAIKNGYSEVQKQGTVNTMWVKEVCK